MKTITFSRLVQRVRGIISNERGAVGTWKIYAKAKKYLGNGTITLGAGIMKMSLHRAAASATIVVLSTRSTLASIGNEISARGGYVANGRAVAPTAGHWTVGASAKQYKFSYTTAGLVFTASGSSLVDIKFAVLHWVRSASDTTRRLVAFCSLSSANFTITSPNTLTILPAATGVFTLA
jgi:hypothetical protein